MAINYKKTKELIKNNDVKDLIRNGYITTRLISDLSMYESFLEQRKKYTRMVSYQFVSDKFGVTERTVMKAVKMFE